MLLSLPSVLYVASGQKFLFTLCLKEKHFSSTQILKYPHRHINASAVECLALYFCFLRLREWVEEFQVHKPVWPVIDGSWHCIDRTGYLCENRPLSTPRKPLSHVRLNLLKLHVLWEKAIETSAPVLKSMLLESIPALGFLLGPCDYSALARPCFCACLSPSMCVCVFLSVSEYVPHQVW